ncbi:MAG: hypothetical protein OXU94_00880 [Gammaproteobacteria bacterium]|nr:hypothetical protein [Gammaproteobacteria bacterium]
MDQDAPFREGIIAPAKLVDYLLETRHKDGGPKANFFIHTCGFSRQRPQQFARALHAQLAGAVYIGKRPGRRGTNYRFCGSILSPRKGKVLITPIWHISAEGATPHFVTARAAKKKEAEIYRRGGV